MAPNDKVARMVAAGAALGIEVRPTTFDSDTRTAADAAAAVGCEVSQIVKSLVFTGDGEPLLFLVAGHNRLDPTKAAQIAGIGAVERADADTARRASGYSIGATPPFGHDTRLRVFMDEDLMQHGTVWAAAGRPDSVFPVDPKLLAGATKAAVADMKED